MACPITATNKSNGCIKQVIEPLSAKGQRGFFNTLRGGKGGESRRDYLVVGRITRWDVVRFSILDLWWQRLDVL
jgi:hypothetical protein